ncbi:MAG TPA: PH domain-containing protein [Anaerolineales bacterium]|nr:PH domain-containing protein [Anaerolineales bacterium]
MDTQLPNPTKTFQPRPSYGWAWLVLMALIIFVIAIAPALAMGLSSSSVILTVIICSLVALAFLILAFWFPTMRYELGQDQLTLRYGPVLTYRIPLAEIRTIRRRNLSLTIWSTIRFPGIALFKVPYADVGNVRMCATAALNNILLIETEKEIYGLTPADEEAFIVALRTRMEQK